MANASGLHSPGQFFSLFSLTQIIFCPIVSIAHNFYPIFKPMKTSVLRFRALSDAAAFIKLLPSKGYRLNTVDVSLSAQLSAFELALAVEEYGAVVLPQTAVI